MLTKKLGTVCAAGLALATLLARPSISFASEPLNNNPPWLQPPNSPISFRGDASIFTTTASNVGWGTPEPLTANDVDYFVVGCGGFQGGLGTVQSVRIDFTHAMGDIDIQVYKTDGTFIGSSTGVTNMERVDVSAQKAGAVVLKVYGYLGAANSGGYKFSQWCQ
jgi:hypothetical protein